ncbi:Hypothetical predicted protein [Paramuricea clavata]|uniref:Uncharacterized protein n=1 Tax=Paramuricea clavata TaxID=317549 RepID=A0A6S7H3I8_PARCT|nr:Hypothetical predicted protein [Paramuricea clavata]
MNRFVVVLSCVLLASIVSSHSLKKKDDKSGTENASKKQMLAPGYYHMECQTKEDCTKKNPKSFCHMFMCVDCLKENVACTQNGQCCDGTECIYGRCKKGAKKDPGAFTSRKNT